MNAANSRRSKRRIERRRRTARRGLALLAAGCLLLAACSAPASATPAGPSVQELAGTMAAGTLGAQATQTSAAATRFAPPTPTPTTAPTLFINAATSSCRSGPGPDFRVIAAYPAGSTVPLAGRDSASGYWIVDDPASHTLCWVSVQDGTPGGSFDLLPEVTPQPVSVAAPTKPGSAGSPDFACDNSTLTVILRWAAPAGPVNGYRIYREGNQVAEAPAGQAEYTEKIPFVYGSSVNYAVAAFNDGGTSPQRAWVVHCP